MKTIIKNLLNFFKKLKEISFVLNGKTVNVIIDVSGSISKEYKTFFYSYVKILLRIGIPVNLLLVDSFVQKIYHLKKLSDMYLVSIDIGHAGDGVQKGFDYIINHDLSSNNTILLTDGYTYPGLSVDSNLRKVLILNTYKESLVTNNFNNVKQKIIKL